jgi:hypothetical protein
MLNPSFSIFQRQRPKLARATTVSESTDQLVSQAKSLVFTVPLA